MIGIEDAPFTYEYSKYFKILPMINDWFNSSDRIKDGKVVNTDFSYSSNNNNDWMSISTLKKWIGKNL